STNVNTLVNAVAQGGAGTILVANLPKLSLTPQFRSPSGLAAAGLADAAAGNFNSTLLTKLSATAAARPGSNIIMMNLFRVGDAIAANPGQFGLTNVTDACFNGVTVCSNPDSYFYFDGVHPTAAGHALIARLAVDYLYYGDIGAQAALQGETVLRHRQDGLDAATDAFSGRSPWERGVSLTASAWGDNATSEARGVVTNASSDGWGARMALEAGPSQNLRLGLAGTARMSDVESQSLYFTAESFGLDLYGGWRSGGLYVNGVVGVARDNIDDIERITSLAPVTHTASTTAVSAGARLAAGVWFDVGGLAVSPRAAVTWSSSAIDGYREQGVAARYLYEDQDVSALTAEASVRAQGEMSGLRFFGEAGYRGSLDDSSDPLRIGLYGNTARNLEREVEDPFGGQVLASAGVEGDVGPMIL
ncbi:hypothetical protein LTR94_026438, partial [Friedmanniomyces endolithicus]